MGFRDAVTADARLTSAHRFEPHEPRSTVLQVLRLALVSDAFAAQVLYRARVRLRELGVPLLPWLLHRASIRWAQVSIGDPVVVHPGVYLPHGQVVIDGLTEVMGGTSIGPFVTLGVRGGDLRGPTVGPGATIGTGAKVLGGITVGEGATIGANAVVIDDVKAGATVVGAPARPVR